MIEKAESWIVKQGCKYAEFLEYGYPDFEINKIENKKLFEYIDMLYKVHFYMTNKELESFCCVFPLNWRCIKDEVLSIIGSCENQLSRVEVEEVEEYDGICSGKENWEKYLDCVYPILRIKVNKI